MGRYINVVNDLPRVNIWFFYFNFFCKKKSHMWDLWCDMWH